MPWIHLALAGTPAPGGSKTARPITLGPGNRANPASFAKYPRLCSSCGFTGTVAVTDAAGKKGVAWRSAVKAQARSAIVEFKRQHPGMFPLTDCAIDVHVVFLMPRPKADYIASDPSRELKDTAPVHHIKTPDATKLWRSTEDALSGIVWADDPLITSQSISKEWAPRRSLAGCKITIEWGF